MDLFCFASRNEENIWRGVKARRWAVATVSDAAMKGRITKARRYLAPGSKGLLYCNPTHAFTTPFIVKSRADPDAVVREIWPEPWVLPFEIEPLGDPTRQLPAKSALLRWPFLLNRPHYKSVTAAMNITGSTVFVPVDISDEDWRTMLDDLARGSTD
jgi:hypothetical protein